MNGGTLSVLVLVDPAIVRDGLQAVLQQAPDLLVVGASATLEEAIKTARRTRPIVALVSFPLPLCAVDATRRILAASPATHVVVLSRFAEDPVVGPLLADELGCAAASGLLPENRPAAELISALREVVSGNQQYPAAFQQRVINGEALSVPTPGSATALLTGRQTQVLKLVAEGLANKQIADRLGISPKTVEKHRQSVKDKLHTNNAADLARRAISMGLVRPA